MTSTEMGKGGGPPGPFAMSAAKYRDIGLSIIPCGGDKGKEALIKWAPFQNKKPNSKTINSWCKRFPTANIGIVTGSISGVTVVDCDNPQLSLAQLIEHFGDTPLIAKTPSGCLHLYYRYNGENSAQLEHLKVDIKSTGGIAICEPSYNFETGGLYQFIEGDLWEFANLPTMKPFAAYHKQPEGSRNTTLFDSLRGHAKSCSTFEQLFDFACAYNNNVNEPPLHVREVERITSSVWQYRITGRLFTNNTQHIYLNMDKAKPIMFENPKALALYVDLLSCHGHRQEPFALCPHAYAVRCEWSHSTVRRARDCLLSKGLLIRTYKGGKHKHDPSLYRLC